MGMNCKNVLLMIKRRDDGNPGSSMMVGEINEMWIRQDWLDNLGLEVPEAARMKWRQWQKHS